MRFILFGWILFSLGISASAQEDEFASVKDQIASCVVCHGENGASTNPAFPILAGQESYYLYVQLKDMKSGLRANPIMSPIASTLERPEMKLIAKFFSQQKWPTIKLEKNPEKAAVGKQATVAGQCVQCHLGGYEGNSRIPRLAGQHPEYLSKTMQDFKNKARTNSAAKSSLMVSYSDEEIEAMAEFMGGM